MASRSCEPEPVTLGAAVLAATSSDLAMAIYLPIVAALVVGRSTGATAATSGGPRAGHRSRRCDCGRQDRGGVGGRRRGSVPKCLAGCAPARPSSLAVSSPS